MNPLTVVCIAAVAACSSGQLIGYPGMYGAYPGLLRAATPITLKSGTPTPIAYNMAPFAPVMPIQTQHHSQDEFGQYSFGFAGGPSSRAETRDAFGIVRGSHNYIDSDGKVQTQHYVADAFGFRVSGTNLPVAPEVPEAAALAAPGPLPEPVKDTAEVAAAKVAFKSAYDEAAAASAAAPDTRAKRSVPAATTHLTPYPNMRFSYGFSAPLNYANPAIFGSAITPYAAGIPAINHAASIPSINYAAGIPAINYATGINAINYAAGIPAITSYAAGIPAITTYAAPSTATPLDAEMLRVINTPNHAVSYRVD
ncbi:cuticle protein 16.5-like [Homarus americanus]|uniref:Cuticle protein 6-like 4 n=1 Tax=Homarus americanus TaxID=6706 RepID=A0A8J5JZB8_HOMAM|nr:cuticle protein 16.5-like [Homarus americanus]KAG7164200.1 Cuticle protein 6-like 4 [Homarus americanus]